MGVGGGGKRGGERARCAQGTWLSRASSATLRLLGFVARQMAENPACGARGATALQLGALAPPGPLLPLLALFVHSTPNCAPCMMDRAV